MGRFVVVILLDGGFEIKRLVVAIQLWGCEYQGCAANMTALEMFLIVIIFVVMIGFLVVIIAFGASLAGQVATLATQLQIALQQTLIIFRSLVNSVTSTLQSFSDTAINALKGIVVKTESGFLSVGDYLRNTLQGIITNVAQQVVDTAGAFARTVVKGIEATLISASSTLNMVITWVGGVVTSVTGLVAEGYSLVMQFISLLIKFIVEGVTIAINLVLDELLALIQTISGGITIAVQDILDAITSLKNAINTGFADITTAITDVESFVTQSLPHYLSFAFNLVFNAVLQFFSGFLCAVVAPLCSALPSAIAPPSECQAIRNAGGC
jgi:hypothetical protein